MTNISTIAEQFDIGKVTQIREYGSGIINETYLAENSIGKKYILQKHHSLIGKEVVEDIEAVTKRLVSNGIATPKIVRTRSGQLYYEHERNIWRMLTYLEGTTFDNLNNPELIKSAGELIGRFHNALVGLNYRFKHRIPHFHDTDFIILKMKEVCLNNHDKSKYNELIQLSHFIANEYYKVKGSLNNLPDRIIHGDLKISNVRFDTEQKRAIALLDLDTMGKNKIVIDIGDALRSICNIENCFDLDILRSFLEGYFPLSPFLTEQEIKAIPDGVKTIMLELAARYITDALEQRYFKLEKNKYSDLFEQNKSKAQSLLELYKDFENKTQSAEDIISSVSV